MRAFAALLLFEFGRRKMLLLAGAVLGVLACVLPSLVSTSHAGDVRQAAALAFGLSILGFGGLLTGTSFLAEDLGSKRYSFYFSAPVSGLSIFASRLIGAAGVLLVSTLLALLPTSLLDALLAGDSEGTTAQGRGVFASAVIAFPLLDHPVAVALLAALTAGLLLALGNALGLAGRARDGWLVLEFVSVFVLLGLLTISSEVLAIPRSVMFAQIVLPVTGVLFGLGLLVAAALQVLAGRTDMPRARAAFALTTAVASLVIGALAVLSSRSYALPDLGDFRLSDLVRTHSYDDRWVELRVLREIPEDLHLSFLVDRRTGRSVRLDAQARYWQSDRPDSVQLTSDGRYGLWLKQSASGRTHRLFRVDLASRELHPTPTGFEIDGSLLDWKISADGQLVGTVSRIETPRPEFGPREDKGALQLSVDRADGTGTLLTRRFPIEVQEPARVIDVSATNLRVLAVARSPIWEAEDIEFTPWTTSSESCSQASSGFFQAHESAGSGSRTVQIDASAASPTATIRRNLLPGWWWDTTILSSSDSNFLLASVAGSVAILDRESMNLVWCHLSPIENHFYGYWEVALALPARRFAILQGPRKGRSLTIVDDRGSLVATSSFTGFEERFPGPSPRIAVAAPDFIEYLGASSQPSTYIIRRINFSSGKIADTEVPNETLDRTSLLFPALRQ